MRWQSLFADLELQMDAARARERLADVPDLTRAERAGVTLGARLRAHAPGEVVVVVHGGHRLAGRVADVGAQWVLLVDGARESLVPLAAVAHVVGLGVAAAPAPGVVESRLGLGHALRAVARDRDVVRVLTTGGTLTGRLDAVGTDHVDVGLTRPEDDRPAGGRAAVAWSALLALSRG